MKPVKTAVVGAGMISHIYIRNLRHLFSVIDLDAIASRRPGPARERAEQYGIPRALSMEQLAADPEIELVVNLTPASAHYEVIRQMLLAGKHVYTEKMLTTDLTQAQELVALAKERGLCLGVAPDTVLGAGLQTAKHALELGLIGDVTSCQVAVNRDQCLNSETYRFLQQPGGSLPEDVGVYYIAALLALLGPAESAFAFGQAAPVHEKQLLYRRENPEAWRIPGWNVESGTLRFRGGAVASILFDGNTVNVPQHVFTIYGTKGILRIGDPNRFDGPVELLLPENDPCVLPFTHGYNGKPTLPEPTPYEFGYGHRGVGVAEMAWAIRRGRPHRCSGELGLAVMEVLKGFEASAASGRVVPMHTDFVFPALPSGYYCGTPGSRADAERSLME